MIGIRNVITGNKSSGFNSLSDWSSNGIPNVIKTPKQEVTVPKKNRVGSDNTILLEMSESSDRIHDSILPFARGTNPFVSVQMNNSGNVFVNKTETSLPYKIQSFRPPILKQEDTLPLSRLPRLSSSMKILPKIQSNKKSYQEVKNNKNYLLVEYQTNSKPNFLKNVKQENVNLNKPRVNSRLNNTNKIIVERVETEHPEINFKNHLVVETSNNPVKNKLHSLPDYSYKTKGKPMTCQVDSNRNLNLKQHILNGEDVKLQKINNISFTTNQKVIPLTKYEDVQFHNSATVNEKLNVHSTNNLRMQNGNVKDVELELDYSPIKVSSRNNLIMKKEKELEKNIILPVREVSKQSYVVG